MSATTLCRIDFAHFLGAFENWLHVVFVCVFIDLLLRYNFCDVTNLPEFSV